MKTTNNAIRHRHSVARAGTAGVLLLAAVLVCGAAGASYAKGGKRTPCEHVAKLALFSDLHDASADYWLETGIAENLPDKQDRKEAKAEAREDLRSNVADAKERFNARGEVCELLDEAYYAPEIDPADFMTPADAAAHPNPYLPLVPGETRVYKSVTAEGTETNYVEVTHETREILGVACFVVHDVVDLDGELIEDTFDWYAVDVDGNVWYFGEQSLELENGKVTSIDGSWEAGEDGALPGIVMEADPQVGDAYRQEFALGEAEDLSQVLSLSESATVPYGVYDPCLQTADFTPLEPGVLEYKYFAAGVGEVLTVNADTGDREELIGVIVAP